MRDDDPLERKTVDWEQLFINRSYLTPVGHGDMSPMYREISGWHNSQLAEFDRLVTYSRVVSAVLNRWSEIQQVCNEPYMTDPIHLVAKMAIQQIGPDSPKVVYKGLQEQFDRLWIESPRPHDQSLKSLAINFGEYLPISRAEIGCLFEQEGWSFVAAHVASKKGYVNDAVVLLAELQSKACKLSTTTISDLPKMGYPIRSALKWMRMLHPDNGYANLVCERWEDELKKTGLTIEQIYAHEP